MQWQAVMSLTNADIRFDAVELNGRHITVAVPQSRNRCWVTSLCTAIGPMARQEIAREMTLPASLAARSLSAVFETLGRWLRIDDVVFPDHRLLTTSLYEPAQLADMVVCRAVLAARYPDRAIVIRSLNTRDHARYIDRRCWPFRVVWLIGDVVGECLQRRDSRRDLELLAGLNLTRKAYSKDMSEDTLTACLDLYRALYLTVYSVFNPDYEAGYVKQLMAEGALELLTLEDDSGHIEAFCGLHAFGDTLSVPLLGYNKARPREEGLYRAVMALAIQAAAQRGLRLNLSAGAPNFKRNRGATPCMEYLLVIDDHLPVWRRWGYAMIGTVLRLMAPILERTAS
jgi:hypothetical protein